MIKFNRATSKDIYRTRKTKTRNPSLEPPKAISIENLQSIADELNGQNSNQRSSLGPPPAISLDDLTAIVNESLTLETSKDLDPQPAITSIDQDNQSRQSFKIWKYVDQEELLVPENSIENPSITSETSRTRVSKKTFDKVSVINQLEKLSDEENLTAWIGSLKLPKKLDTIKIKEDLRTFLRNKPWEKAGSIPFEGTTESSSWGKKMILKFKELSVLKQTVIIIGVTILIAAGVFVTVQMLSLLWPSIIGVAGSGKSALVEIGVEAFKQRQEPAFHLLNSHAEQAKPMSYAWANQYILWKYCA